MQSSKSRKDQWRETEEEALALQLKMSSFFFTKVPPEEQMYTDIKSLNKFDEKAFCQLVDIVFSFLVSPKEGTRFMSQVSEFAGEHGVSANVLKNVVKSLLGFFKSALKSNLTPAQVKEDLEHLGKIVVINRVRGVGWENPHANVQFHEGFEYSRLLPGPHPPVPPGNDSLSAQGSVSPHLRNVAIVNFWSDCRIPGPAIYMCRFSLKNMRK